MIRHCHRVMVQHDLASLLSRRSFHVSVCCDKNIRAGVQKISRYQRDALTYEQANPPESIGVTKAWTSWNTSNLYGESDRRAETTTEDILIRRFMAGTWVNMFKSPVIIKRRQNLIVISGVISTYNPSRREIYFLKGYTQELLSLYLKRPVRLELQTIQHMQELEVKRI